MSHVMTLRVHIIKNIKKNVHLMHKICILNKEKYLKFNEYFNQKMTTIIFTNNI